MNQDQHLDFSKSEKLLKRALKTIPLGSQTFSKSKVQFPYGVSPFFAEKAEGAYVWDVDGNRYVDFMNGLLAITLGHCHHEVVDAVESQLQKGTIFSLASQVEMEVAEKICEMVPSAEMVRFGKNGSDATSAAIRLARAVKKKDHVLLCGYHGWQDWYIGTTTKDLGVPETTKQLSHTFYYNDIESLTQLFNQYRGQVAAVILEPMNVDYPQDNFLEKVKEITHQHQALLIFDETITGFRFAKGGAQELFGVVPDLTTLGKGLANGFPLSAVTGSGEYMRLMEEIFFSTTFGGETLSLVAANVVLDKIKSTPVLEKIHGTGTTLLNSLNMKIDEFDLVNNFSTSGHPSWSFFLMKEFENVSTWDLKTLFIQEMFANGIISVGTHNMSYTHDDSHINLLMQAYQQFFQKVQMLIEGEDLTSIIKGQKLSPIFTVR